ncbi:MAG: TrmH family RNA methyltransferase [Ignavibacteria bacterium]
MKIQRISTSHLKEISKLKLKKYRDETQTFIIETEKVLDEAINSDWKVKEIYLTKNNIHLFHKYSELKQRDELKFFELSENEFKKISNEVTPPGVAALVEKKSFNFRSLFSLRKNLILLFEKISDPGNLGTILRTADWFGFQSIVLSKESVEFTNPKVVRASMGSIFHLNIYDEVVLDEFLIQSKKAGYTIVGTTTNGKSITRFSIPEKVVVIFGNESKGISQKILSECSEVISIPSIGKAESLNLAISTSIILYELRRKEIIK